MIIVNKPENFTEVKCYKCNTIFKVHDLQCMNSPFVSDCNMHLKKEKCDHIFTIYPHSNSISFYLSNEPKDSICTKCGFMPTSNKG